MTRLLLALAGWLQTGKALAVSPSQNGASRIELMPDAIGLVQIKTYFRSCTGPVNVPEYTQSLLLDLSPPSE